MRSRSLVAAGVGTEDADLADRVTQFQLRFECTKRRQDGGQVFHGSGSEAVTRPAAGRGNAASAILHVAIAYD